MGFDYDQLKSNEGSDGSFWASYSDLFMVLSLVFLLLYVTAGLRAGTNSIQQYMEYQQLKKENADYKEQIKAYNTLKDDYLAQGASQSEAQTYEKLMEKLSLLKEEAKNEKDELRKAAQENAEKEQALNQYQQIVRNIINTNMLSAARMKRKNKVITKIDKSLEEKKEEVKQLNKVVAQKQNEIENKEAQIEDAKKAIENKVAQLKKAFEDKKITQAMMNAKLKKIQLKAAKKISALENQSQEVQQELQSAMSSLNQAQEEIESKDQTIASQSGKISDLQAQRKETEKQIEDLRGNFMEERKKQQKAFNDQLKHAKMSARERDKKIRDFRNKLAEQRNELDGKIAGLQGELENKENALAQAQGQAQAASDKARELAGTNAKLSKDLKKAKAALEAKKKLVGKIAKNLNKAGVKANVDQKTGDVVLSFGDEYFETGKADLKSNMKTILKKFMPVYSKSLLSDKETAEKIRSVEVVGFASPTYKGKYVDPVSLEASNRSAASYNLDLSYYRAKSIFDYIFDTKEMTYQYQKELLPLVKVVGRSYFAEGADRAVASKMSRREYCAKYDCKKAQRVIIKFDLENL